MFLYRLAGEMAPLKRVLAWTLGQQLAMKTTQETVIAPRRPTDHKIYTRELLKLINENPDYEKVVREQK